MLWRFLATLVVIFWLVMAGLLMRVTYYPEGFQFAQMPPGAVLKLFLDRGASGKQLHLYHGEKKIGHVTLDLRRMQPALDSDDFTLLVSGMLETGALPAVAGPLNWRVNINLREGRHWAGAGGQVRMPDDGVLLDFNWLEGRATPEFTLHRRGSEPVDDQQLKTWLGPMGFGNGTITAVPGDFLEVTAREGIMKIAGQNRKGYVIGFSLMDRYRATAFFTEEGDLALVELPEGYRALEPNIHGLVPDE